MAKPIFLSETNLGRGRAALAVLIRTVPSSTCPPSRKLKSGIASLLWGGSIPEGWLIDQKHWHRLPRTPAGERDNLRKSARVTIDAKKHFEELVAGFRHEAKISADDATPPKRQVARPRPAQVTAVRREDLPHPPARARRVCMRSPRLTNHWQKNTATPLHGAIGDRYLELKRAEVCSPTLETRP